MNDLDELVRDGLRRAAADVPDTSRRWLASELMARRQGRDRRRTVRVLLAAALVVAVGAAGLAKPIGRRRDLVRQDPVEMNEVDEVDDEEWVDEDDEWTDEQDADHDDTTDHDG